MVHKSSYFLLFAFSISLVLAKPFEKMFGKNNQLPYQKLANDNDNDNNNNNNNNNFSILYLPHVPSDCASSHEGLLHRRNELRLDQQHQQAEKYTVTLTPLLKTGSETGQPTFAGSWFPEDMTTPGSGCGATTVTNTVTVTVTATETQTHAITTTIVETITVTEAFTMSASSSVDSAENANSTTSLASTTDLDSTTKQETQPTTVPPTPILTSTESNPNVVYKTFKPVTVYYTFTPQQPKQPSTPSSPFSTQTDVNSQSTVTVTNSPTGTITLTRVLTISVS